MSTFIPRQAGTGRLPGTLVDTGRVSTLVTYDPDTGRVSTLVTRDPNTGLRRGPVRWPDGTPPPPFGCRRCGFEPALHGLNVHPWERPAHPWERPTGAQILARMRARRAAAGRARSLTAVLTAFERGADLVGPAERRRRRTRAIARMRADAPARCDDMTHDCVGAEVFCQIEDPDHEGDHDAGDGLTWPRED
ncbi:hypothetical protein OG234_13520 [Streptomyces sp. NBC_01420]|uniref:hypothetical protein n=1 Tax=Streptomyces sp. NBC_01420 TaxID=2903858 RepID=UPI0032523D80